LLSVVSAELAKEPLAKLEYAKLCDPETLIDIERVDRSALLALAVRFGKARLIDNRVLTR
jgi:pantoate--beta-alanine ligase